MAGSLDDDDNFLNFCQKS